jgi:hypothetical protein
MMLFQILVSQPSEAAAIFSGVFTPKNFGLFLSHFFGFSFLKKMECQLSEAKETEK